MRPMRLMRTLTRLAPSRSLSLPCSLYLPLLFVLSLTHTLSRYCFLSSSLSVVQNPDGLQLSLINGRPILRCEKCNYFYSPIEAEATKTEEPEHHKEEELFSAMTSTPKELNGILDEYVIEQQRAKRVLSVAVCKGRVHPPCPPGSRLACVGHAIAPGPRGPRDFAHSLAPSLSAAQTAPQTTTTSGCTPTSRRPQMLRPLKTRG